MHKFLVTSLYTPVALAVAACGEPPRADSPETRAQSPAAVSETAGSRRAGGFKAAADAYPGRGTVPIEIEAVVGDRKASAHGPGECTHTDNASIYQVLATQWRAEYRGSGSSELEHLNLTLWQPKAGGNEFTLAVQVAGATHQIATVKRGDLAGNGTATVRQDGTAGTFVVDGKDEKGISLRLTVRCERFTEPVAEGG